MSDAEYDSGDSSVDHEEDDNAVASRRVAPTEEQNVKDNTSFEGEGEAPVEEEEESEDEQQQEQEEDEEKLGTLLLTNISEEESGSDGEGESSEDEGEGSLETSIEETASSSQEKTLKSKFVIYHVSNLSQ